MFETAFEKRECRERSVPAGLRGVPEKLFFPLFFAVAGGGKREEEVAGTPADPGKGLAAPCNPLEKRIEPRSNRCSHNSG